MLRGTLNSVQDAPFMGEGHVDFVVAMAEFLCVMDLVLFRSTYNLDFVPLFLLTMANEHACRSLSGRSQ